MSFDKTLQQELTLLLGNGNYPEALNYQEIHGFLSALNCSPYKIDPTEKVSIILYGENTENEHSKELSSLILELDKSIQKNLLSGETLFIPCTLALNENGEIDTTLDDWLYGFFEAYFIDEEAWYRNDETLMAEMLLPLLAAFHDIEDEQFDEIRNNRDLLQNLIYQIPQALQDLFLFHSSI